MKKSNARWLDLHTEGRGKSKNINNRNQDDHKDQFVKVNLPRKWEKRDDQKQISYEGTA